MSLERINQDKIDRTNYLQTIDELEREAIDKIYRGTNEFVLNAVTKTVQQAKAVTDPQIRLYYSTFLDESTKVFERAMLGHQANSIANVQHVAQQFRTRR